MPASIVVTGIPADYPNPGDFVEVNYAQGASGGNAGPYDVLLICNKLSSGAGAVETLYGPDTPVQLQKEEDCIAIAGPGSEAHRLYRAFRVANTVSRLFMIFVTQSGGAQATLALTLATTATGNGNLRVYVGGGFVPGEEFVDVPIFLNDTPDAVKARALDLINARTYWPVIASSGGTGIISLTAKQNGTRGNDIMVDKEDEISTTTPDVSPAEKSMTFIDGKKAFYLNMPLSYLSGQQTTGIGSTGEADMRAVERGLKQFFSSIVRPVLKALFGVDVEFKSQDFRHITSGMEALKTFGLTNGDGFLSQESMIRIVCKLFDLDYDKEKASLESEGKDQDDPGKGPAEDSMLPPGRSELEREVET